MHIEAQRTCVEQIGAKCGTGALDHELLYSELKSYHQEEHWVSCGVESPENVQFIGFNNPTINLIEQVHQDERVEAHGVQNEAVCGLSIFVSDRGRDQIEGISEENELS